MNRELLRFMTANLLAGVLSALVLSSCTNAKEEQHGHSGGRMERKIPAAQKTVEERKQAGSARKDALYPSSHVNPSASFFLVYALGLVPFLFVLVVSFWLSVLTFAAKRSPYEGTKKPEFHERTRWARIWLIITACSLLLSHGLLLLGYHARMICGRTSKARVMDKRSDRRILLEIEGGPRLRFSEKASESSFVRIGNARTMDVIMVPNTTAGIFRQMGSRPTVHLLPGAIVALLGLAGLAVFIPFALSIFNELRKTSPVLSASGPPHRIVSRAEATDDLPSTAEAESADGGFREPSGLVYKLFPELLEQELETETRQFDIDRKAAQEKLRSFQLADPHACVLLLLQALFLKGAKTIRARVTPFRVRLEGDGRPFTLEELDRLHQSAFIEEKTAGEDALAVRELSLGCNAAMALPLSLLRLRSGDGRTSAEIQMRPGLSDAYGAGRTRVAGTVIELFYRKGRRLLERLVSRSMGTLPEAWLIENRCRYSEHDVILNKKKISGRLPFSKGDKIFPIRGDGFVGVGALDPGGEGGLCVHLVQRGIWVATHLVPSEQMGFLAVVEGTTLRKDASQADFVTDDRYRDIMKASLKAMKSAVSSESSSRKMERRRLFLKEHIDAAFALLRRAKISWGVIAAMFSLLVVSSAFYVGWAVDQSSNKILSSTIVLGVNFAWISICCVIVFWSRCVSCKRSMIAWRLGREIRGSANIAAASELLQDYPSLMVKRLRDDLGW